MKIRKAVLDDWKIIQALNLEIFEYEHANFEPTWNVQWPFTETGIRYFQDGCNGKDNMTIYVGEVDNEIVAYGALKLQPDSENVHRHNVIRYDIDTICVKDGYRDKGYGKIMVDYLCECAKEAGGTHIGVMALSDNDRAIHVYEACGLKPVCVTFEKPLK